MFFVVLLSVEGFGLATRPGMSIDAGQRDEGVNPAVRDVLLRCTRQTNWLSLLGAGLSTVPAQINCDSFPFLTQLYLGHNRLRTLPEAIFDLVTLRGLFVQGN